MHSKQRGVTLIGWVFLLLPIAIVVYAGIRLAPVYLNYMKVARSMDQLTSELHAEDAASPLMIRNALEKHLDIQSVTYPEVKDFEIRRDGAVWIVQSTYEETAPLFSNISIVVAFDKTVRIQ
jgi:Domain of unknown function (DUF4845)